MTVRAAPSPGPREWRHADRPLAAHDLAQGLLGRALYEHTRGVAQQAARLARTARLDRTARARLLSVAWLHEIGHGLGPGFPPISGARALRRAGHEGMARIVAHRCGAALEASVRGLPPVGDEFPEPRGDDRVILGLIDVAGLTTGDDGRRVTPADRLATLVAQGDAAAASVRALVATAARVAADPVTRGLAESVAPLSGPYGTHTTQRSKGGFPLMDGG